MKMTYLNTLFFIIEEDAGIDMKEMTIISTVIEIELRKFVNIFYIIFDIKI